MSFADNYGSGSNKRAGNSPAYSPRDLHNPVRSDSGSSFSRDRNTGSDSSSKVTSVTNDIRQLSQAVAAIERMTGQLGTAKDSQQLREQLLTSVEDAKDQVKDASSNIKTLDSSDRITQQKLTKDLQLWVGKFQEVSRIAMERERTTPLPASTSSKKQPRTFNQNPEYAYPYEDDDADSEKHGLIAANRKQEQMRMNNEVQFNTQIIQERDKDLKEIEKNVIEVNEIFRDLSTLVVEQGAMIDSIESNIEDASLDTKKGYEEVVKASSYQKKSRTKLCCLLLIIVIVVAVLILLLWLFVIKGF